MVNGRYLKKLRKAVAVVAVFGCMVGMGGCQSTPVRSEAGTSSEIETIAAVSGRETEEIDAWKKESYQEIVLEGDRISADAYGVTVDGTRVTITSGGTYVLSGTLQDGQIVVDASKEDKVILVWNGAEIFCENASPVLVIRADKTIFYLADGTTNVISDGKNYSFANGETEPDAAVFAKDDLTIKGTGSLTVNANYYDGIVCKNDLKITGGILTVNAVHQGIKGKDSLTIQGGTITVNAGDDGIKSSNEALVEEDGKEVGWVLIEGGTIQIAAGDDAIHAESDLTVNGGNITITESYEGLEGARIFINGGKISLFASDDGINAVGYAAEAAGGFADVQGADGQGNGEYFDMMPKGNRPDRSDAKGNGVWEDNETGRMGRELFEKEGDYFGGRGKMGEMGTFSNSSGGYLEINGGTIYVNANGDGIDVNGSVVMNDGIVQIDGTENSGNGALDYDSTFEINGGVLIGVGSSTMAQTVTSGSTQNCMAVYFEQFQEAGSMIRIRNSSGEEIFSYTPQKRYSFLTFSSEQLKIGDTYTVLVNGVEEKNFVLSEAITTFGNGSGKGNWGNGGRNRGGMSGGAEEADGRILPEL